MKKNIALVAGGYSDEFVISMRSAATIAAHLDPGRFAVYKIIISKEEWWFEPEPGHKEPVDKNDFSVISEGKKITFDAAFIAIHGSPGEDGKLQGYLDMLRIPYTTCNSIVSALTFNKSFCSKVLKDYRMVHIANSVVLYKHLAYSLGSVLDKIELPVFVKPNESGSSLGTSKVTDAAHILDAVNLAFKEDHQVLIEEFVEGRELTIGVFRRKGAIVCLPPTEIISKNAFFDFEAKYTTGVTDEITPARIAPEVLNQLNKKAKGIYTHLNCSGMVRIDFILERRSNELYFLEVNSMPGQSENSLIPQAVIAAGMSLQEFYGGLLDEILPS